ncbi:hypothetical protein AQI94_32850 [Streptomyces pseudovenezuelae]|uniref:3-hydroxyacyl-CoA dehydrogenase C-terminal domain-containing protein n=1 Tax=Streptomyces pseudovenezuelae TaxID=67350 RepID=A0A101N036_9ACTN|nr:hypothetical protein AQI94_32850 [Streptomyces pseudovenezuelae]
MSEHGIRRVGVVAGGQTGAGIAEVCARAGLDTVAGEVDAIADSLYDECREPLYAPPPLQRMVEAGLLGRKTGRGFHIHDQD